MPRRSADNAIDWDGIQRQYRLGQKTAQQLAAEFGVAVSSITRRIKRYGWVADKTRDVAAITNSLLIQNATGNANPNATPSDGEIKAAGREGFGVVLGHRKGLGRLGQLRDKLTTELEAVTDNTQVFEELGELMRQENARGQDRRNDLYHRVISLPERIEATKKLAEIDERIRRGEREAFGLNREESVNPIDEMLLKIGREREAKGT